MRPLAGSVLLSACVATNPAWDGPPDAASSPGSSDARAETGAPSSGSDESTANDDVANRASTGELDSDDGTTTAADSDASSTAASTSTSSDGGVDDCPDEQSLCDGQCKHVLDDKRACGVACVDCTELFGNNARCEDGVCEPHD